MVIIILHIVFLLATQSVILYNTSFTEIPIPRRRNDQRQIV